MKYKLQVLHGLKMVYYECKPTSDLLITSCKQTHISLLITVLLVKHFWCSHFLYAFTCTRPTQLPSGFKFWHEFICTVHCTCSTVTIRVWSVQSTSVLAFCPSVTLKKRSYEGLAPPWKLSQIVEIKFFWKFQGTKILLHGCGTKWHFCQNVRPSCEHFSHLSWKLELGLKFQVSGKEAYLQYMYMYMWLTSVYENIRWVQAL